MQKFTIFTVILSVLVITIISELVVQDYLQKIYQPGAALQANTLGTGYVAPFKQEVAEQDKNLQELKQRLEKLAENQNQDSTNTNSDLRPASRSEVIKNESTEPFEKINSLLPALQIRDLSLTPEVYNQRLFQLIDTTSLNIPNSSSALIKSGSSTIGTAYEFQFLNAEDAENAFDEIRILANSFQNINTNQTNQFGDRSYYINHLVKVGEVFLVVQSDNIVSAFAYKKDYHETFKTFFGVLF